MPVPLSGMMFLRREAVSSGMILYKIHDVDTSFNVLSALAIYNSGRLTTLASLLIQLANQSSQT
jgi:hypothetical protein